MKKRMIAFLICMVIGVGGIAIVVIFNKKETECKAVAMHIKATIIDQNNLPLANVKIYEDLIADKERAISNSEGEFEFYDSICGEITLQFVTPDGENYIQKYDRENIPKLIKLENKH